MLTALFVTLALLGAGNAAAEADGPDYWSVHGVAANDVLNLRAKAGPQAEKIAGIPPGAGCLKNLGCVGGLSMEEFTTLSKQEQAARERKHPRWCRIEYQGQRGWVAGRYLNEGRCDQARD
jgi:uncharacterized protein YgiM (DUF1202 family)